jgi:beta-lactamase class D
MSRILLAILLLVSLASCSLNNLEEDESLEKYFTENHVTGSFGMFNNALGKFTVYNTSRFRDSVYLPASTFKIVNSVIALHTGVAPDEKMIIPWDKVVRPVAEWNHDLTMADAFKASAVPWFQELARRIGKDTMQYWLDSIGYGRQFKKPVITEENLDTFWLDNSVRVSADEQLGLVKKLYFDQLPFQKRAQRLVREMMLQENNSNYKLSYKSGWGTTDKGHALGWLIGWIEENNHVYLFVLNVESPDENYDMTTVRLKILKDILKGYGFFEGKK